VVLLALLSLHHSHAASETLAPPPSHRRSLSSSYRKISSFSYPNLHPQRERKSESNLKAKSNKNPDGATNCDQKARYGRKEKTELMS